MSGKGKEIRIHFLHINGNMGCALSGIHKHYSAHAMNLLNNLFHRVHASDHIGNMGDGCKFRLRRNGIFDCLVCKASVHLAF